MKSRLHFRPWHLDLLAIVAILVFVSPLFHPLLRETLPVTHDGHHHIYRLYALDQALRGGSLWPRWFPGMGFGYGFPVLNFYAPLVYYVGEFFHIFGVGFLDVFRLLIALGFILPAWAFYAFARYQLGRAGAFIGALIYIYATYHIGDGYVRAALPEHWAFLFPPLLLLAMWHIGCEKSWGWTLIGSLTLAAFFLMHNLSVILFAPMLALYGLGWIIADARSPGERTQGQLPAAWVGYALMALFGVGLAAFFILPGALEVKYIHASTVATGLSEYTSRLAPRIGTQLSFPWQDSSPAPYPPTRPQFLIAATGLLAALITWRRLGKTRAWHTLFALTVAGLSLFLMSGLSAPLLTALPQIAYLQYPWRWNAPLVFALAYLAGNIPFLARVLPQRLRTRGVRWLTVLISVLIAIWIVPHSFPGSLKLAATTPTGEKPLQESDLKPGILAQYDFQTGLWLRNYGGPWLFEYLPVWAEDVRDNWFLPDENPVPLPRLPLPPHIEITRQAALRQELAVSSPQAFTMRWHSFYFPGWQALVDGKPTQVSPSTRLGLITARIPAGDHTVSLRFGATPARRTGTILSLLSLLGLLGLLITKKQWRTLGIITLLALGILLPFKLRQTTASAIYTPEIPRETWTIFEDRAQILGYHVQGRTRSGNTLYVTLHWQALRQVSDNDQVYVTLLDYNGQEWSKDEHQPGFGFTPTSRWQPGEIIPDAYTLSLPADMPPGNYQLRMGLYNPTTLIHHTAHNSQGDTSDQIWLGDVVIAP